MTPLWGVTMLTPQPLPPLQELTKCSGANREIQPPTKFTFKQNQFIFFSPRIPGNRKDLFLLEKVFFGRNKKENEEKKSDDEKVIA